MGWFPDTGNQNVGGNLAVTGSATVAGAISGGSAPGGPLMELTATTGITGFTLVNGTPTILTWTAPNDGNMHRFLLNAQERVTSAETGGAISLTYTDPGGTAVSAITIFGAGQAAGSFRTLSSGLVAPNTTVTLSQSSALTVGAAVAWAEIWAS